MLPAFFAGHIISDNSFLNVNWSRGFSEQLFAGYLYPRWLPEMNAGAGSPVFYFYGPLPFYLNAPFELIFSPRLAVLWGMWLMLALSGQAFAALAASLVRSESALIAAIAYMAMPYHLLVDIWLRSDLGELAAYIFTPLCVLCTLQLGSSRIWMFGLAFSIAGLLFSHLPSAELVLPFLSCLCVFVACQNQFAMVLLRAATAVVFGFGLAAVYVIPAVLLQNLIHAEFWTSVRLADSLLFTAKPSAFELFLDAIVVGELLIVAAVLFGSMSRVRWRSIAPWTSCAAAVLFLISPAAAGWWNLLPAPFEKVQYAWRTLMLLDLAVCILFALALDAKLFGGTVFIQLMTLTLGVLTALFIFYRESDEGNGLVPRSADREERLIARRVEPLEYLPSCGPFRISERSNGKSGLIVHDWIGGNSSDELAVFYYPFLEVKMAGKQVPTKCDPTTGFTVVGPHDGPVDVQIRPFKLEFISMVLSGLSLALLLLNVALSTRIRFKRT